VIAGRELPPLVVFRWPDRDTCWLADGFHRVTAYQFADFEEAPAVVYEGGMREALLYSVSLLEDDGGLELTDDDVRAKVQAMLNSELAAPAIVEPMASVAVTGSLMS